MGTLLVLTLPKRSNLSSQLFLLILLKMLSKVTRTLVPRTTNFLTKQAFSHETMVAGPPRVKISSVIKGPSWYCDIFWNTCLSSLGSTIGYRMAEEGGRLISFVSRIVANRNTSH